MQDRDEVIIHVAPYVRDNLLDTIAQARAKIINWRGEDYNRFELPDGQSTGCTTDIKTNKQFVRAISEFLETNVNVAEKLCGLHEVLRLTLADEQVRLNAADLLLYREYMQNIEIALSTFHSLNYINSILPPNAGPVDAMALIGRQFISPGFQNYVEALTDLTLKITKIDRLLSSDNFGQHRAIPRSYSRNAGINPLLDTNALTDAPVRLISQWGILVEPILKYWDSTWVPNTQDPDLIRCGTGPFIRHTAKAMAIRLNERKRADENATYDASPDLVRLTRQTGEKANIALCNELLKLNINNPLLNELSNAERERTAFFDRVLRALLVDRPLSQVVPQDNIRRALGIVSHGEVYNPGHFNPAALQALYANDHNPLWLVLKSTIPISDSFSPKQKVQAYIDIADLYADKKLVKANKHVGVYAMAKAAFAVAEGYPSMEVVSLAKNAFSPRRSSESIKRQLREHQFGNWMVSKSASHNDNVVNSEFLAAHGLRARTQGLGTASSSDLSDSGYPTSSQSTPKSTPKSSPARSEDELPRLLEEDEAIRRPAPTIIIEELEEPRESNTGPEPIPTVNDFDEPNEPVHVEHLSPRDKGPTLSLEDMNEPDEIVYFLAESPRKKDTYESSDRMKYRAEHSPRKETTTGPGQLSMFASGTFDTLLKDKAVLKLKSELRALDNPLSIHDLLAEFKKTHSQRLQGHWSKPIITAALKTIEEEALRQTGNFGPGSVNQ